MLIVAVWLQLPVAATNICNGRSSCNGGVGAVGAAQSRSGRNGIVGGVAQGQTKLFAIAEGIALVNQAQIVRVPH